ncbi:MAG TPA: M48 family metallopeptidase [Candidatus Thermoplasmatota archaeon]|nr:M48 family metallopeptidase [Candidatus Thermoplasmatota archaeon]
MAAPMLLDEQVRHNKAATVRLFVLVFLILAGLVFAIGLVLGYPPVVTGVLALVIGLVYLGIASSTGVETILKAARARPANPNVREERLLLYAVEEMAIAAGLSPVPKVYVQEDDDINAFAAGRDAKQAVVCATTGALRALNQEELQGVIAHELSHIRNQDVKVTTYAIALIGLIAMLGEIVFYSMFLGGHRRGRNEGGGHILLLLAAIVFIILAPLLSKLVYFAISRRREYLADASGAELTRNPEGLASALEKIAARQPHPDKGDRTVAALYLDNPFRRLKAQSAFSTHPPIEERIRRLRGQA